MAEYVPTREQALVAMLMTEGVGPAAFVRLLDACGSPEAVFSAGRGLLAKVPKLSQRSINELMSFNRWKQADEHIRALDDVGAVMVSLLDDDYPMILASCPGAPAVFFMRGSLAGLLGKAAAIVGTRTPTPYGRAMAARLGEELAAAGYTVVSGAAAGVDGIAHNAALDAGGSSIGVLGCGFGVVFPEQHAELYERLAEGGALVTEFLPGTPPLASNFPRRNRIISGLSAATVVVEAGSRSGALITARYAAEQNRDVCAMPGRADSYQSKGANRLIRQGAHLVECAADVIELIEGVGHGTTLKTREKKQNQHVLVFTEDNAQQSKGLGKGGRPAEEPEPGAEPAEPGGAESAGDEAIDTESLGENERLIFSLLDDNPKRIDALVAGTELPAHKVSAALLNLEILGLLESLPGQLYARKN